MPQRFVLIPLDIYQNLTTKSEKTDATSKNLSIQALTDQRQRLLASLSAKNPYAAQKFLNANQKRLNRAKQVGDSERPSSKSLTHEAATQTTPAANEPLDASGSYMFDETIDYYSTVPQSYGPVLPSPLHHQTEQDTVKSNEVLNQSLLDADVAGETDDAQVPLKPITEPPPQHEKHSTSRKTRSDSAADEDELPAVLKAAFTTKTAQSRAKKVFQAFVKDATIQKNNMYQIGKVIFTVAELRDVVNYALYSNKTTTQPAKWNSAWPAIIRNSTGTSHFAQHLNNEVQRGCGKPGLRPASYSNSKLKLLSLPF